ncbi:MAG: hypothetical protein CMJ58_17550 [Planctomycetaceae bacterium]|nr:hypothetical protein [Planctomycetaceae bacterium]
MSSLPSPDQIAAAGRAVCSDLAAACDADGVWREQPGRSPLATAAAISALVLAERHVDDADSAADPLADSWLGGVLLRTELNQLVAAGLRWLARVQNDDGGWGDAAPGRSQLDATMAVEAAFQLTGVPARCGDMLQRARRYVAKHGGVATLRDAEGERRAVAAGVMTLYAAAGLTPWRKTPAKFATLAMASAGRTSRMLTAAARARAIMQAAAGLAQLRNAYARQPLGGMLSGAARLRAIKFLESQQAPSGGFLDSPTLTALVTCGLACGGLADKVVVRQAVEFLLVAVREDNCWADALDVSVRTTVAAMLADAADASHGEDSSDCRTAALRSVPDSAQLARMRWLLGAQMKQADAGGGRRLLGWSWSDRPGVVSSVYDTGRALAVLAAWRRRWPSALKADVQRAALAAIDWLLVPHHASSLSRWRNWLRRSEPVHVVDATAATLRALSAWRELLAGNEHHAAIVARLGAAIDAGLLQLAAQQQADGAWIAERFGNATYQYEGNPVMGTAIALRTCVQLGLAEQEMAQRGAQWLASVQHPCGGWGPAPRATGSYAKRRGTAEQEDAARCTLHETAAAVAALAPFAGGNRAIVRAVELGAGWLVDALLADAPIKRQAASISYWGVWYHGGLAARIAAADALRALAESPLARQRVAAGASR